MWGSRRRCSDISPSHCRQRRVNPARQCLSLIWSQKNVVVFCTCRHVQPPSLKEKYPFRNYDFLLTSNISSCEEWEVKCLSSQSVFHKVIQKKSTSETFDLIVQTQVHLFLQLSEHTHTHSARHIACHIFTSPAPTREIEFVWGDSRPIYQTTAAGLNSPGLQDLLHVTPIKLFRSGKFTCFVIAPRWEQKKWVSSGQNQ